MKKFRQENNPRAPKKLQSTSSRLRVRTVDTTRVHLATYCVQTAQQSLSRSIVVKGRDREVAFTGLCGVILWRRTNGLFLVVKARIASKRCAPTKLCEPDVRQQIESSVAGALPNCGVRHTTIGNGPSLLKPRRALFTCKGGRISTMPGDGESRSFVTAGRWLTTRGHQVLSRIIVHHMTTRVHPEPAPPTLRPRWPR